jgi:hypothetical protein
MLGLIGIYEESFAAGHTAKWNGQHDKYGREKTEGNNERKRNRCVEYPQTSRRLNLRQENNKEE